MSDKYSLSKCSGGDEMNTIATDAKFFVQEAAKPVQPGDTVKAQMNRAAEHLGYKRGYWRIKDAWYGEAGCWSAKAFEDLKRRYCAWKGRQEARAHQEADVLALRLNSLKGALNASDPDFHRNEIDQIERALRGMGREGGTMAE